MTSDRSFQSTTDNFLSLCKRLIFTRFPDHHVIMFTLTRFTRHTILILFFITLSVLFYHSYRNPPTQKGSSFLTSIPEILKPLTSGKHPPPRYKPTPSWLPPPVFDPFPLLANTAADPPPIPEYNIPRPEMHKEYGLDRAPPLFIGFTRQWPMLLQAVVSYITAGWPPENIYVVENTGVHNMNKQGRLTLQNPFYLNHTTLHRLGVTVIQTPVLLTFAQMQNFFLSIAYQEDHPYYFYSHQDVLVFSFEEGLDFISRPADGNWEFYSEAEKKEILSPVQAGKEGYRTIYENCLRDLQTVIKRKERWGFRWYQYDHLTLVNREAMEAVGGWDSLIPYYATDCDMNGKMGMDGWTMKPRRVGIINDVSTVLEDLEVLYRNKYKMPKFIDPAPLPPEKEAKIAKAKAEKEEKERKEKEEKEGKAKREEHGLPADQLQYFRALRAVGDEMGKYKYRDGAEQRNNWQRAQRGGEEEPFYYNADGFHSAFWTLTDAGRRIYEEKWGHRGCDLASGTSLTLKDQWRVEKDWEKKKEDKKN
ncbi:uncharacterized protein PODANS_1_21880 [Podospora anserina S mat+]|uniref:Podospora anserina S mat+ genomic DNA chromosome 1, supercontig 6 n=1 Tax=Podospora anserina (strain S / ATCC MYA-4624 / DSM 980 / FGSC 10383) TaxID=515849 RepID=B2AS03_PODAN|nr:uncharacterized protein PODANS_1_21880 [Podospora anserina S mat+]CAP67174.1 unnamed protein product [Podospora anserina S mat+]CDP24587.1 Putative protein of unknown function [Podospora anserina S mat+]